MTTAALCDIEQEIESSTVKHGDQSHIPDGTGDAEGHSSRRLQADLTRFATDHASANGCLTWRHILDEEVAEAFAETDPAKLRAELVQVAAVAAKWVEAIDGRAL